MERRADGGCDSAVVGAVVVMAAATVILVAEGVIDSTWAAAGVIVAQKCW